MKTEVTELLGIEYPIIQGGMPGLLSIILRPAYQMPAGLGSSGLQAPRLSGYVNISEKQKS